jgi:TrwC relaxase
VHRYSRAGDLDLHTHVAVANRVDPACRNHRLAGLNERTYLMSMSEVARLS